MRPWAFCVMSMQALTPAFGQSGSLALSSSTAASGGSAILSLTLTAPAGSEPAALQWTLTYDPSAATVAAAAGSSAASAAKALTCGGKAGSMICVLAGLNATPMANGTVALVTVTLAPTASGSVPVGVAGTVGASPAGTAQALTGSGGTVSVNLPPTQTPVISGIPAGVLDAGSYTANLAQGGIFVVKGTNLSPAGIVQAPTYPLPTSLNGVSIGFRPSSGGAAISAYLLYTYNANGTNQLAAVLPSAVPAGTYNVTVTNNGATSAAVPVSVVARKFELFTADTTGSGEAAAQNVDASGTYFYNRFTTGQLPVAAPNMYAPAHPGDTVIVYGTGMGPISGTDNGAPGVIDLRSQVAVQVLVGGQAIAPLYAGRSPNYAGLDQINLQLPASVPTGCTVSFQVSVGGQISSPTTIAIAPAGSTACVSPIFSQTILHQLDQGRSVVVGDFLLSQLASQITPSISGINESVLGSFASYSGFQLGSAARYTNAPGVCQVFRVEGNANQLVFGALGTGLDAGTVTLNGPNVSNRLFAQDPASRTYSLPLGPALPLVSGLYLPAGFPFFNTTPVIASGTYQLTGSGGSEIGAFSASATVGTPPTLTATLPPAIPRGQALTLSWTGGNPTDLVGVTGASGTVVGGTAGSPIYDAVTFTCTTTVSAQSVTVPAAVLQQLPVTPTSLGSGIGYLEVSSWPAPTAGNGLFTAPLTGSGSLDSGVFLGTIGAFTTTTYQ
ncbi:MAG: hypothetical protein LAP40_22430 [Acidobacteriia bacterium]|nr:hypothetical protein [Terriglobia bacterium]